MKKQNEKVSAKDEALKDMNEDLISLINEGNISKALSTFKTLKKEGKEKVSLIYKDEVYKDLNDKQRKSLRQKVRKKRHAFAKDIIALNDAKEDKLLKESIATFIKFYKTFYKLNDLTLSSLSAKNNDDDTSLLLNAMLKVINEAKVKV